MAKTPRIPILATAATRAVLAHELFPQMLEHWQEVAGRIVIVIPRGTTPPAVKKVRYVQVPAEIPTLGHVVQEMTRAIDAVQKIGAIVDPFTVLRYDIFKMFQISDRRQLSLSWMATSLPVRLVDFDTPTGIDETQLTFFCAPESIWNFLVSRHLENAMRVPFLRPAWSGWLATWATQHVHTHKYHDISDLRAVGLFEDIPEEEVNLDGIGKLTFNPPVRNYVTRIDQRIKG